MSAAPQLPRSVLLVRHGQTEWSAQRRHTGRTDLELTDIGEVEAVAAGTVLAQLLGIDRPTAIYSSPLRRAVRTAQLVLGRNPTVPVALAPEVIEWDYGDYEGHTGASIAARRPGWGLWTDGCPNGESPADVWARAGSFLERIEGEAPGGVVVVFTHGHMSRALTARLLGLGPSAAAVLHNDTASVAELRTRDGKLALVGWNVKPHGAAVRSV
jgi:probable phosphoglycerate mutase